MKLDFEDAEQLSGAYWMDGGTCWVAHMSQMGGDIGHRSCGARSWKKTGMHVGVPTSGFGCLVQTSL